MAKNSLYRIPIDNKNGGYGEYLYGVNRKDILGKIDYYKEKYRTIPGRYATEKFGYWSSLHMEFIDCGLKQYSATSLHSYERKHRYYMVKGLLNLSDTIIGISRKDLLDRIAYRISQLENYATNNDNKKQKIEYYERLKNIVASEPLSNFSYEFE